MSIRSAITLLILTALAEIAAGAAILSYTPITLEYILHLKFFFWNLCPMVAAVALIGLLAPLRFDHSLLKGLTLSITMILATSVGAVGAFMIALVTMVYTLTLWPDLSAPITYLIEVNVIFATVIGAGGLPVLIIRLLQRNYAHDA